MTHVHLIWFWWKAPRLSDEMAADLSALARWLGKGYFLKRIKSTANEIVGPQHILFSTPDWSAVDREDRSLLHSVWRATMPVERWLVLGFLLFAVFAMIYVGDPRVGLYIFAAMLVWWGIYFGSLTLAIRRCSRWLDELAVQHPDTGREPTETDCKQIIQKWAAN